MRIDLVSKKKQGPLLCLITLEWYKINTYHFQAITNGCFGNDGSEREEYNHEVVI